MTAPALSAADKDSILAELTKSIGVQDKGDVVKNFFHTLSENNRLSVLESVCENFGVLMSAHRGEVELNITSAVVCAIREAMAWQRKMSDMKDAV